jgi:YD repeat-containing protein
LDKNYEFIQGCTIMDIRRLFKVFLIGVVVFFAAGTARAETVNYTYDAAGRLVTAQYSSGITIQYTYDKAGNLLQRSVTK